MDYYGITWDYLGVNGTQATFLPQIEVINSRQP
jgi:hypothetical protein